MIELKNIRRISKDALFGIIWVKWSNKYKSEFDSYYETLDALRSLFKDIEFNEIIDGFYLNHLNAGSVRISYFVKVINIERLAIIFNNYFKNNGVEITHQDYPVRKIVAEDYGGQEFEEAFRNFLILETQIGLELLKANPSDARPLFATYIFQTRNTGSPAKLHLEPRFSKYSNTYNSLSNNEKSRFFTEFDKWNHLMVNFVLGFDGSTERPLSISKINEIVEKMGFQISMDWRP